MILGLKCCTIPQSPYETFQRIDIGKVDFFEIQTDKAVY